MGDTLALCYHAVSDRWPAALSATPDALEAQLRLLVKRGYRGVTFTELASGRTNGRAVALTFDDAFRSVHELAFPLLRDLGLVASVYVVTKFGDSGAPMAWDGVDDWLGGPFESEMTPMSWDQLGELREAGWEIGSHTHTHPRLSSLDDAALTDELERSRQICVDRMGGACTSLAYPYGDHDARVVAAAGRAGYTAAGTLPSRQHPAEPLRWPRVGIYHVDTLSRFRAKVSPTIRRLRSARQPLDG